MTTFHELNTAQSLTFYRCHHVEITQLAVATTKYLEQHSPTKKYFFVFALKISTVLGYIRCADFENGLTFAELALVCEIIPITLI